MTILPSSAKLISPASKAASYAGPSMIPLKTSRRSWLSESRHGLMCDARNSPSTSRPVTAHLPDQWRSRSTAHGLKFTPGCRGTHWSRSRRLRSQRPLGRRWSGASLPGTTSARPGTIFFETCLGLAGHVTVPPDSRGRRQSAVGVFSPIKTRRRCYTTGGFGRRQQPIRTRKVEWAADPSLLKTHRVETRSGAMGTEEGPPEGINSGPDRDRGSMECGSTRSNCINARNGKVFLCSKKSPPRATGGQFSEDGRYPAKGPSGAINVCRRGAHRLRETPLRRGFLSGRSSNLMPVGCLAMGAFRDDASRRWAPRHLQAAGTVLSRLSQSFVRKSRPLRLPLCKGRQHSIRCRRCTPLFPGPQICCPDYLSPPPSLVRPF